MKTIIAVVAVALFLVSPAALSGKYYGAGLGSCGEWLDARQSGHYYTQGQWVLGFLSALTFMDVPMAATDSQAISAWMDNYCRQNPLDDLIAATSQLATELIDRD